MKKKLITGLLATLACCTLMAGCSLDSLLNPIKPENSTDSSVVTTPLEEARDYVKELYKSANKSTSTKYTLINQVTIDDVIYPITWSVNVDKGVVVEKGETETTVKVVPDDLGGKDLTYTLTGTITAPDGKTIEVEFKNLKAVYPTLPQEDVAYKLYMAQRKEAAYYYLNGSISSRYFDTTTSVSSAKDFYFESVDETSFKIYYKDGETKKYMSFGISQDKDGYDQLDAKYENNSTEVTFAYEASDNFWYATYNNKKYGLGTFGDWTTVSYSGSYFFTDATQKANQYVLNFVKADKTSELPKLESPDAGAALPITHPETNVAYKFYMAKNPTIFLNGATEPSSSNNGTYLSTTSTETEAKDFYVEKSAENVYKIYYVDNNTKYYMSAYVADGDPYLKYETTTNTTFSLASNSKYVYFYTVVDGAEYGVGTFGSYTTASLSELRYYGNSGTSTQYPLTFVKASDAGNIPVTPPSSGETEGEGITDNSTITSPYTFDPNKIGLTESSTNFTWFKAGDMLSFTSTKNASTHPRYWNSNGNYTLRFYAGEIFSIDVKEGYKITAITIETSTYNPIASEAYLANGNVTTTAYGSTVNLTPIDGTKTISITAVEQIQIKKIIITYEAVSGGTVNPNPGEGDGDNEGSTPSEPAIPADLSIDPAIVTVVNNAYALTGSNVLENQTVTGTIISVDTPYDTGYSHVTVTLAFAGTGANTLKCFRLKGTGADTIGVGDVIKVTGKIKLYYGVPQFDSGCQLTEIVQDNDNVANAVRAVIDFNAVNIQASVTGTDAVTINLPATGTKYNSTFTWSRDNETCTTLDNNVLTVTPQATAQVVIVSATVKCGESTITCVKTIDVAALPDTSSPSLALSTTTLNTNGAGYATDATQTTVGDIGISYVQIGDYGNGLQWRTNSGVSASIWNTTALPGKITKIVLTYNTAKTPANGKNYTLKLGTTAEVSGETLTVPTEFVGGVWTIEVDGAYTFFQLTHANDKSQYWDSIVIYYEA